MFNFLRRKRLRQPRGTLPAEEKSFTLPELTPSWSLFPQQHAWDSKKAIEEGYNASPIVYAATEKRAQLVASIPLVAKQRQRDGTYEHRPESPLQKLLDNPNPNMSGMEFLHALEQSLCLAGNGYFTKYRGGLDGREPIALWPLPARYIELQPGKNRLVDRFLTPRAAGVKLSSRKTFATYASRTRTVVIGVCLYCSQPHAPPTSTERRATGRRTA